MANIHDTKEVLERLIRSGLGFPGHSSIVHISLTDTAALHEALRYIERAEKLRYNQPERPELPPKKRATPRLKQSPVCCKCQANFVKKKDDLCGTCEDSFGSLHGSTPGW